MNVSLAKELYFRELDAKVQQDQRLAPSLVLLSLIGGVIYFLIQGLPPAVLSVQSIATTLAVICYAAATVYVGRATVGHAYEVLPDSDALLRYYTGLAEYYCAKQDTGGTADGDFEDFLLRHLVAAATRSRYYNLRRAAHYYLANRFAAAAIALAAVAGLARLWPYIVGIVVKEGAC
jgi:hypothetical protein